MNIRNFVDELFSIAGVTTTSWGKSNARALGSTVRQKLSPELQRSLGKGASPCIASIRLVYKEMKMSHLGGGGIWLLGQLPIPFSDLPSFLGVGRRESR